MDLKKIFKGLPDWNKTVNDNFDLINKRVEQDTGWIKANLTGGAINNNDDPVQYRKVNNLVIVRGYLRVPESGGAVIWTPPTEFVPPNQMLVRVAFSNSDTTRTAIVRFWGGKLVSVYNNSSGDYCYIEAIYYV
ncbi:hypothetical protein MX630_04780 [Carnobacterium divergens]|uniref:hypothetical protein n=1 Tax=Carnobacterium divergens TaxID=2748 RepID=UPI00128DCC90|nr:hypothetical protein [Carnobacterium divergens]MDT1950056.1 hypothetical protein [Carnobacterium divergens]MDT1955234.1 hypothetical protein [Carnobacterium divergens]MDT1960472.1 hypothetical protein [Carnobacterium divergens]MDT1963016.1 hypothetical protein [Carnobacterium divergens]MPQ22163.1 hypothetical protein [Carnobacterium divergens]